MNAFSLCCTLLVWILSFPVRGTILPVPGTYPTIQEAIVAATAGDTILVDNGTYYENINFRGKSIILASRFLLTGDPADIGNTIIDGSQPADPDSASCIIIAREDLSLSTDTVPAVIGFTITNGTGTVWEDEHGPGLWYREGGGILIQYCAPRIRFNRFINNDASNDQGIASAGGGGIRCGDGNPDIANNIFTGNTGKYGGGLVLNYSGATIRNNIFSGNSGGQEYGGGGIWVLGNDGLSRPRLIENNTIVNNSSSTQGGGLKLWSTVITLRNNIIWGNTAGQGPQIHRQGGTVTVEYCDVMGGYSGMGNIDQEPVFTDTAYIPSLQSPCVDAGDSSLVCNDPENPQAPGFPLYPARGALRNDMGAYGGPGSRFLDGFLTVGTPLVAPGPHQLLLLFPNPASAHTSLCVPSFEAAEAVVTVHSMRGEPRYRKLHILSPGENCITISLEQFPSGLYLVSVNGSNIHLNHSLLVTH